MISELAGSLAATISAQNTGIGTYPGTTGLGQYAAAGASGGTNSSGPYSNGGQPAIPFSGLDVQEHNYVAVSIRGSGWTATINLDRSLDGGATWQTLQQFTAPVEQTYEADAACLLRLWCATGNFTSGSIPVLLRKG